MTYTVNGEASNIEVSSSFHDGQISYQPYEPDVGQVITVEHEPFVLSLVAVKQFTDNISGKNRGHFDIRAELTGSTSHLTGVLGATLGTSSDDSSPEEASFEVPCLAYRGPTEMLRSTVTRPFAERPSPCYLACLCELRVHEACCSWVTSCGRHCNLRHGVTQKPGFYSCCSLPSFFCFFLSFSGVSVIAVHLCSRLPKWMGSGIMPARRSVHGVL